MQNRFALFFLLSFLLFCSPWAKTLCFEGESPGGKILKKCQKVPKKCENYETILPFSCCPLVFPWKKWHPESDTWTRWIPLVLGTAVVQVFQVVSSILSDVLWLASLVAAHAEEGSNHCPHTLGGGGWVEAEPWRRQLKSHYFYPKHLLSQNFPSKGKLGKLSLRGKIFPSEG